MQLLGTDDTAIGEKTAARLTSVLPVSRKECSALVGAIERALRDRLKEISGSPLDRAGRVADLADALVGSIGSDERAAIEADLTQGSGGELRNERDETLAPRFHSARSSCALAVNTFGPWRLHADSLEIAGSTGFTDLRFERKCPITGVPASREPPNLDALMEGERIVAVESKLIEYITPKKHAQFSNVYERSVSKVAHPSWAKAYERLSESPEEFQCFDAAQIVKHYLGIKSVFPDRQATLLYVYWEPWDEERHRLFAHHRAEIASFARELADPQLRFESFAYSELWNAWTERDGPTWLQDHIESLRRRYVVPVAKE
jgi:restriction endonuclease-like protein